MTICGNANRRLNAVVDGWTETSKLQCLRNLKTNQLTIWANIVGRHSFVESNYVKCRWQRNWFISRVATRVNAGRDFCLVNWPTASLFFNSKFKICYSAGALQCFSGRSLFECNRLNLKKKRTTFIVDAERNFYIGFSLMEKKYWQKNGFQYSRLAWTYCGIHIRMQNKIVTAIVAAVDAACSPILSTCKRFTLIYRKIEIETGSSIDPLCNSVESTQRFLLRPGAFLRFISRKYKLPRYYLSIRPERYQWSLFLFAQIKRWSQWNGGHVYCACAIKYSAKLRFGSTSFVGD